MRLGTGSDLASREGPVATAVTRTLREAVEQALAARERIRVEASNERLIAALAKTARSWTDHEPSWHDDVVAQLAAQSSLDPGLLECGLELAFAALSDGGLRDLLSEAEAPGALEHAVAHGGNRRRLSGPPVVFHSLAGNVPALALPVIAASLLARSVAVIRDSARQRGLTHAFLAALAKHDADAAAMIVPVWWPSGDADREREAIALAERVELYGSEATLHALRSRHGEASARMIERGSRLSVGVIPPGAQVESCAVGFADDLVLHDGLGCLTPHVIFVVGAPARGAAFAEALSLELAAHERRWPRQPRTLEVEAARRAFVDECDIGSLARDGERVRRGIGDAWLVHLTRVRRASLGPGLRCVRVVTCEDETQVLGALEGAETPLAAVGLANAQHVRGDTDLVAMLRARGATLVCPPGRMQAPPLAWSQDGRRRLGDLLAWTDETA